MLSVPIEQLLVDHLEWERGGVCTGTAFVGVVQWLHGRGPVPCWLATVHTRLPHELQGWFLTVVPPWLLLFNKSMMKLVKAKKNKSQYYKLHPCGHSAVRNGLFCRILPQLMIQFCCCFSMCGGTSTQFDFFVFRTFCYVNYLVSNIPFVVNVTNGWRQLSTRVTHT